MVSEPSMASSDSNSRTTTPNPPLPTIQAPLLLLSNMANLMSIKLDSTNFIVWKHQLSSILKAYSMIDFVDGTVPSPSRFLVNPEGNLTTTVNPEFQIWNIRDQALLTLINSTLSQPVLSMVVGQNSAQSVWKTLEHRFTSTSRANVLNLKIELHNLKKGSETVSSYLQKVKNTRDKLIAVGTLIDNEEMLHIILKGLPKEYGPFCSAIRTRNEPVSFEEIMVLLQTEEQSIAEVVDSSKDMHSMAMFASAAPNTRNNSQASFYFNNSQNRGHGRNNSQRGRGGRYNHTNYTNQYSNNQFPTSNSFTQNHSSQSQGKSDGTRPTCQIYGKSGHQALDCYHMTLPIKVGIHLQSWQQWPLLPMLLKVVAVGNGQSIPINNIGTGQIYLRKVLYKGLSENGLYPIHTHHLSHSSVKPVTTSVKPVTASHVSPSISAFLSSKNKWQLWHHRLGHPSDRVLVSAFHSTQPLELIHSDVWGPAPVNSSNGYRYYLLFVDDYSRFSWLYLLKHKSDVLTTFTHFKNTIENQLSKKIKFLRTDCGGEYTSNEFIAYCNSHGITHQLSCPHTPQQNGIVERKHRHIVECAITLLSHASLPITHWSHAVTTAIHLINRIPTPKLTHKSPWEMLFHKPPDLTHLKTFGCMCFPYLRPYNTHKLQPRTTPCLFLGYPPHSKGYICLDPKTNRTYISRHVLFNESEFLSSSSLKSTSPASSSPVTSTFDLVPWLSDIPTLTQTSSPTDQEVSSPITHSPHEPNSPSASLPIESTIVPSASLPIAPSAPVNTHPMNTRSKHGIFKPKSFHTTTTDYTHTEPPTYQIASKFPQWCSAMDEEFSALQRQQTWSLVPPPFGKNIVGCKWVFKLKRHSDGSISRYKARLVAKGFHQQHGIDFEETFSPVVKPPTVRLILALSVTYNWPLRQLDVRNAFLHGFLKEEVYMIQPPGYVDPHHPQHVCRLQKSIYGLKQAPRAWFESFTTQLLNLGFQSSHADSSLFIYKEGSVIAFLLLYVDDIVLTGNNVQFITQLITNLSKVFELKDMGTLSYFLGLQIQRSLDGLSLTQTKYATDLLTKHNMLNSLHYLTFTRPDLSFAVHQVCQFMNTPTDIHLTATKRILRYLRGTLDHGLHYTPGPISISAFSDADWAGDPNDRRSTSGLLFFLGNNPITWSAKKQLTVSRSSTEAEYRALASASAELCWLRTLLKDLGLYLHDPPILWCDNISALAIASNPVFHARTKHIEVDFHFIRERVLRKDLQVKFVSTNDQLADIFTKGLPSSRFRDLQSKLLVPVDTIRLRGDDEVSKRL
uniref:Integrase catalytic domain-containing protein n=1 Tax=Fagus sylvatica TaxID=28930 RepID=A0A2N9ISJ0_FAGSY